MEFDGPVLAGRWRLGPALGEGGQGRTFLARDTQGRRDVVVVKQLVLGGSTWKKFDLFEREVRVLKALRHPGIPAFLDHFESDPPGSFYLVMERAPGETLKAIGRFTDAELRDVLEKVLEILAYLHGLEPPVIHRDLKPANILRSERGRVSVVDFGGVREALRDRGGSTVVGTFGYMAPEQLHGQATPATDIYGLGATIVALAGGVEPEDVPRAGLRMDLPKHLSGLDRDLVDVLVRMTEPDPDDRPQSAEEVLEILLGKAKRLPKPKAGAKSKSKAKSEPAPPPPKPDALATVEDDDDFPLELDIPQPLQTFVMFALRIVGFAGNIGLAVVQKFLLPVVFTIVSAFVSKETRPKLRSARDTSNKALGDARTGFRKLQRTRGPKPRQLPAPRKP